MNDSHEIIKLYDTYKNKVYRLALSYLKNTQDAEDVVQVVFLKLIDNRANIIHGKEQALITQITINHCKDILRSFWRKNKTELNFDISSESEDFENDEQQIILNAVIGLSTKYRIAVYLHYYDGYTFSEIAKFLNISPSAVSMRIHRARKILKKELGGLYYDEL
ncbi:MAG: RNA polymerase sigma factor [bacterium]